MFFVTKISVLLTVLTTVSCGVWWDRSAPYFPIEISRTATGRVSSWVFPLGATVSFAIAVWESSSVPSPFLGFLILAWISDEKSWPVHMIGVLLMVAPVAWQSITGFRDKTLVFLLLCCVYLVRLAFKGVTVMHHPHPIQVAKELMYTGAFENDVQALAFKIGGVLQWAFLYGIMEFYTK